MSALDGGRLFHVNVNCRSLARSRPFYEALGLTAGVQTAPEKPQPGLAFGLRQAWWDAWIMTGARGFEGAAVDLLEWKEPVPAGAPPASFTETGWQRLGLAMPDLDRVVAQVPALGGAVRSAPHSHTLDDGRTVKLAIIEDPDGTAVECIEGSASRVSFVAVSCRNLDRSTACYAALGFREVARFTSHGEFVMDEVMLAAPGGGEAHVLLVHVVEPGPQVAPARKANTVGIWRAAFLVPDIDAAWAAVAAVDDAARLSPPVAMAMGEGLPELRFGCFRGPDGEVLELIEQPG
ncbi:MAG TPA: VOC family protein [Acidimicrobiia bacterium]|nr:VOC family protein [Acidimicrobiia bacterium]